ncbi:Uncharacterized protein Rs2_41242 [Raphanus sativus]|nr:Uncharacterized protein Rs2_41242 [Raphanus sativus]
MTSIKEKDEIALCQNTFALKGFVHAIQLVMVEAVPALTEVVQEAASSSDTDSDREEDDLREKHNKRLTLSPGHARDVDQKCEVPVKCINEDEASSVVEDEEDDYSDEEIVAKVENVLRLYSEKHCFNNSMFKRGLAMADVERMSSKGKSKKRATKATKKAVPKESGSEERFATLLYDKMKPEISKFREMAKNINATVKVAGQEFASMESQVGSIVENKIKDMIEFVMVPMVEQRLFRFKEDIIQGIESIIKNQHQDPVINSKGQPSTRPHCDNTDQPCYGTENGQGRKETFSQDETTHSAEDNLHEPPTRGLPSDITGLAPNPDATSEENERDHHPSSEPDKVSSPVNMAPRDQFSYIENPSFSLGLSQEEIQDHTVSRSVKEPETRREDIQVKLPQRRKSLRLKTTLNSSPFPSTSAEQMSDMELFPVSEIPSFSLGLSQDDNNEDLVNGSAAEQVAAKKSNNFELQDCRRGKRQKTVTHGLVDVFQCSPDILNRARDAQMVVYGKADSWEYTQKYTKLAQKLKSQFVINIGGCNVSTKDIVDIVERARLYSAKVMDILMKHLSLSYAKQSLPVQGKRSVFFNTKFVASLSTSYLKFSKVSDKKTHMFTKSLVDVFGEVMDHLPDDYRFYFPFNLDKKHWVGLCVDPSAWLITVMDCNTALRSEALISSEFKPLSEMFPYLMRQAGFRILNSQLRPMVVERAKSIPQNIISADSSLTSILLMQTHALSGIETCRCITPHILASEAQRMAVLLYEYHMKL